MITSGMNTGSNVLDIPSTIGGKVVSGLSAGAFGRSSVLSRFQNESTYSLNDETNDEENSFSNITRINIPSSITEISANAFSGMENLTTFTVNGSSATSYVETIKSYAFYGCENLTEVNINYASNVETMAFANCSSLATIYALGVTNAEIDAFSNTQWIENQLSNNDGKVVLGELLVLYAPENKTVMELSDWDFSVAAIAENAFAFSDVETIYVPSRVSRWNEYAFANAQELKDVYVEKMNSSLLNSLRVKENIFGGNHEDFKLHVTRSDNAAIAAMGQNALTGIPREVISTNVTCVNNGVTTTRTLAT